MAYALLSIQARSVRRDAHGEVKAKAKVRKREELRSKDYRGEEGKRVIEL